MENIGFMQGRLSPMVEGRIQSFPWSNWRDEFIRAEEINLHIMEWTLDSDSLYENPLLTRKGQLEILKLCSNHKIHIPSLTGDCFMQEPFWKSSGEVRVRLEKCFLDIANACAEVGISLIVIPLVDNGQVESQEQEDILVNFMKNQEFMLDTLGLQIAFESDFAPSELARFILRFNPKFFGINYDIGNSASMGFNPIQEFEAYGHRILNVHIKDRVLGGTTVDLGRGNANFEIVFRQLGLINYCGNFILQTARATDDNHGPLLSRYRDMTVNWVKKYYMLEE
jgi:L-ribulose-5-phosphate 3-epimerase